MISRLQALLFMLLNQGVELCKLKKYFWHISICCRSWTREVRKSFLTENNFCNYPTTTPTRLLTNLHKTSCKFYKKTSFYYKITAHRQSIGSGHPPDWNSTMKQFVFNLRHSHSTFIMRGRIIKMFSLSDTSYDDSKWRFQSRVHCLRFRTQLIF